MESFLAGLEAQRRRPKSAVESGAAAKPDAGTSRSATATAVRVLALGKAVLPTSPSSPDTKLNLALGTRIGLALGMAYAVIRRHLDRRIRQAAEIERLFGVPAIGTLPRTAVWMAGAMSWTQARQSRFTTPGERWLRPFGSSAPTSASWTWTSRRGLSS